MLEGINYFKTKALSLPELALVIETDLLRLANSYHELACAFKIELAPHKDNCDGLKIKLISNHNDSLMVLRDEVYKILASYNKQILLEKAGRLSPRYCRFYYNVEFEYKKLSRLSIKQQVL